MQEFYKACYDAKWPQQPFTKNHVAPLVFWQTVISTFVVPLVLAWEDVEYNRFCREFYRFIQIGKGLALNATETLNALLQHEYFRRHHRSIFYRRYNWYQRRCVCCQQVYDVDKEVTLLLPPGLTFDMNNAELFATTLPDHLHVAPSVVIVHSPPDARLMMQACHACGLIKQARLKATINRKMPSCLQ